MVVKVVEVRKERQGQAQPVHSIAPSLRRISLTTEHHEKVMKETPVRSCPVSRPKTSVVISYSERVLTQYSACQCQYVLPL